MSLNYTSEFSYDDRLNRITSTNPLNEQIEVVYNDMDLPAETQE